MVFQQRITSFMQSGNIMQSNYAKPKALLKSGMIGSKTPNHPALFSCQESATPSLELGQGLRCSLPTG
jgi:hypothetical protein